MAGATKKTAKKTAEQNQPMDPGAAEVAVAVPSSNHKRVCYAAQTLVAEVEELFPEIPVEYSNVDGRNTALDVAFDLTVLDPPDVSMVITLLDLTTSDPRVREVMVEDQHVLVGFRASPRTQDSRDPFGLGDALVVLDENDGMGTL